MNEQIFLVRNHAIMHPFSFFNVPFLHQKPRSQALAFLMLPLEFHLPWFTLRSCPRHQPTTWSNSNFSTFTL